MAILLKIFIFVGISDCIILRILGSGVQSIGEGVYIEYTETI